jgi:hypothetical protein
MAPSTTSQGRTGRRGARSGKIRQLGILAAHEDQIQLQYVRGLANPDAFATAAEQSQRDSLSLLFDAITWYAEECLEGTMNRARECCSQMPSTIAEGALDKAQRVAEVIESRCVVESLGALRRRLNAHVEQIREQNLFQHDGDPSLAEEARKQ